MKPLDQMDLCTVVTSQVPISSRASSTLLFSAVVYYARAPRNNSHNLYQVPRTSRVSFYSDVVCPVVSHTIYAVPATDNYLESN